jgi:hypothetical protein
MDLFLHRRLWVLSVSIFEKILYKRYLVVAVMQTEGNLISAFRQQSFWFRFMAMKSLCDKYESRNYEGEYMTLRHEVWPSWEWMERPACLNHKVFCFSCEDEAGCSVTKGMSDAS